MESNKISLGIKYTKAQANLIAAIIFVLEFAILAFIYYASFIGSVTQVIIAIISLILSGIAVRKIKGLQGGYGLYMAGSRRGISTIDSISKKNKTFWEQMPIWGIVIGFGIFSYFLLNGKLSKKTFILGMASLVLILLFIMPCTGLPLQFVNLPGFQSYSTEAVSACSFTSFLNLSMLGYAIYAFTIVFGLSGFIISSLLLNAANILSSSILFAITAYTGHPQSSLLTSQVPGVAPVIPGIDIPLIAGIISLVIILTIHEMSHGVLARMAKVKVKSIGLLLFGIIPIGAFVEPNEKEILKLNKEKQNRISAAGISANFIATIVFFILMMLMFAYVVPGLYQNKGVFIESVLPNTPANGILQSGMQIIYWDGHKIANISALESVGALDLPGKKVNIQTLSSGCSSSDVACVYGNYSITAVAMNGSTRGLIGITAYQKETISNTLFAKALYFLYTLFALSFLLNFLVGIVNLLPIPGFDGWRIYKTNIKSDFIIKFVEGLIIIGLILNAVPWLFIALIH
jgi:membrane-associated protease RseP (regulator of RpoE activity)